MRTPCRPAPLRHLELRAYHEAGHAVVALARGLSVRRVSIAGTGRVGGSCEYGFRAPSRSAAAARHRALRDVVAVVLAGSVAQDRLALERGYVALDLRTGMPFPLFASGAGDDERSARRLAARAYASPGARRAFLLRMRARVERLLRDRVVWSAVRRLARALLRRRTVDGRDARAALRSAVAAAVRARRR